MPRKEILVEVEDLVKRYRGGVEAVRGVSFRVGRGVHMLMGPNGSGKTTTLTMIAGALKPTSGSVRVCGYEVWGRDWARARSCIGFAPQDMPFRERLTLVENLVWYGLIRGLGLGEARRRALRLLELVGLSDHANDRILRLSGGMRRRLSIAAALMREPEVLILDEPTSGLDPQARRGLWGLVRNLAGDRCVLASTHIAEDAEEHADTVIVFHKGRIAAMGSPRELLEKYAPESIIIVRGRLVSHPRVMGASLVEGGGSQARYATRDPNVVLPRLIEAYVSSGSFIESVEIRRPGLDEVYFVLTGSRLSVEEG